MVTVDLKKKVIDYIDNADDRLLKLIKALVETYQEEENDFEISEEHKKILDQRLADHKANPNGGKDWTELKSELRTKYWA
jgi:NADPH:quinone reductase-like Zn-dependent oxidoreductase